MVAWHESVDFLIVGSGGGAMCAALVCRDAGKTALVLEKEAKLGGSTAMSGGILWIPANPVMARLGVEDSFEEGLAYLNALVGDVPGSSPERKKAYLRTGPLIVEWLQQKGIKFVYDDGRSDYFDELPGGKARGRSVGMTLFDVRRLGAWKSELRQGPFPYPTQGNESRRLALAKRTLDGFGVAARVGWRMITAKLFGRELVGNGAAMQGWMLSTALKAGVDVRLKVPVNDFVVEDGRVTGVIAKLGGKVVRIRARDGVLINAGGFAQNAAMRSEYGPQPSSTEWTHANPGDTGEMIRAAMRLGAEVRNMDQAIWLVTSLPPGGKRAIHANELGKPHLIVVDKTGARFTDEAGSYVETGKNIYRNGAVPCWAIMDSRHRQRYNWAKMPPGFNPPSWVASGYMKKADTLEELAHLCGIAGDGLKATVERFNGFAAAGRDLDFKRGDRAYDRYWGDPTYAPNPCLGAIDRPPFYAVALFPGDVGTFGGVMTDEHARVLRADGSIIEGLYATGNSTASVHGDQYPGAGASIGAAFVFGYRAAQHAVDSSRSAAAG